jgi:N4-(beta-N-acetylglucosaminyl)-L-asparaginase
MKRRTFLKTTSLAAAATAMGPLAQPSSNFTQQRSRGPLVVNTWDYGRIVPETGYRTLLAGGTVIDAVERAVRIPEADPEVNSVGRGGLPDRDGHVTLDASIMDGEGRCGSVVFLKNILHPISVARKVMEATPHVLLAGDGAFKFALEQGFTQEILLTPKARKAYQQWLKQSGYRPKRIGKSNHDTIGLIAMDGNGKMAGGCSTSGLAWKMHGRVGDSPIIGAGLYVDNEVGAATATGLGEAVLRICGSFLIVELMRQGKSPLDACRIALERMIAKQAHYRTGEDFLVGFCAFNKDGEVGGYSYRPGFEYCVMRDSEYSVVKAKSLLG